MIFFITDRMKRSRRFKLSDFISDKIILLVIELSINSKKKKKVKSSACVCVFFLKSFFQIFTLPTILKIWIVSSSWFGWYSWNLMYWRYARFDFKSYKKNMGLSKFLFNFDLCVKLSTVYLKVSQYFRVKINLSLKQSFDSLSPV